VDRQLETHLFDEWVLLDNDVDNDSCPWLTHPTPRSPSSRVVDQPENILLKQPNKSGLKVIDLGSACFDGQTIYPYIQSRFYRAPEVVLGVPYDNAIDMWSIGCIAAELFVGLPIFPGVSEHAQLARIMDMFQDYPPLWMLTSGRATHKMFDQRTGNKNVWWLWLWLQEVVERWR
jgi:serine/threonine protein kinase